MKPSQPSSSGFFGGLKALLRAPGAPWMLLWIVVLFFALALGFAGGCARTVLIPEGAPVRIGPKVQGKVYARVDGEWELSENRVDLPEGWYLVPPSFVEQE